MSAIPNYLLNTYVRGPLTIERGEGCYFWDVEGRRYLDFISGLGVNALGYANPRITNIIRDQAALCVHTSNLFHHPYQNLLAKRLAAWSTLAKVFFSNSGAEAMELAIKSALAFSRGNPRKRKIVSMRNSFHGRTTGALSVTGRDEYRKPFGPLLEPIEFVDANDCRALNAAVDDRTIAVITETIQGEAGIYPLKSEFLSTVRDLTRQAGALWIADETQCGLGRTGWRFAYQMPPIVSVPDVVATAKPLAAGLPLGATIFSEEAATIIQPGMHASTFGGGPLACRVALETLSIIDELLPHIRTVAAYMENRLSWLQSRHSAITEVRGAGLMTGIQLNQPGHRFVTACLDHGLAINCTRSSVLRLLPPYIVTPSQIDEAVAILDAVLKV